MSGETNVPLDRLEHEVEESRANVAETINELQNQVAGTVEDLKSKFSPDEIRGEVKRYFRDTAVRVRGNLGEKAARHPAAAVAIGAAALWPVVKLAVKIPVPVYLMAAGVSLMRPVNGSGPLAGQAAGDATERVNEKMRDMAGEVMRAGSRAQSAVSDAASQVASGVRSAAETLSEAGERVLHRSNRADEMPYPDYPTQRRSRFTSFPDARSSGWALALIGVGLAAAAATYVPPVVEESRREERRRVRVQLKRRRRINRNYRRSEPSDWSASRMAEG